MFNFLQTYLPQPILFQFGFIRVYWYGLFIVLGTLAGLMVVLKLAARKKIPSDEIYNLGFYLIIFSLIGARIYSIFLDLPYYLQNPFEIVAVWHGGLAIHGAIIGGVLTLLIYCWRKKYSFWLWADILAVALPLGQGFGRWGNYFNQELFGKPTDLPWGIPIALENRPIEYLSYQYFHPTFIYESILNLLNFLILLFLFHFFYRHPGLDSGSQAKEMPKQIRHDNLAGVIFLIYLINYSFIRILMEFLRTDPAPLIYGFRLPVIVSGVIIVLSLIILIIKSTKSQITSSK
ncbi:MAG: prolipoprotein diacylglyceryl transferase [Candidatus Buchananbacteria bacterium RIFCSPHIGHO2_01_FULL_39_14]|uniref:Phosphatidylglycerol--prolipoprotein diacylglyceryl transferase n=2 Tax=Candidatus Buchananiibacteriota TaxID=1817903 RepID=A0A1G1YPF4_9BACT|nr:MAG: prolipoprotein diacylglyceryl transferase [Candidatus Buchananbacteria bacterium RIFCSPHIGHO2_01_FULL_39_14]OGY48748.1 MAG: prolipoprotein diacylglyceryl transferase [Candidatus Buchananbacteria bacterium RIFCSPHIGHO2_02_FULL_39_17]OGY53520.1 MAG: prolipoprotein diacylglyceryl transferase [Candidatus Buchananbacteria bacterium RIFCSPLOWO2_01_FULL_40_23b]